MRPVRQHAPRILDARAAKQTQTAPFWKVSGGVHGIRLTIFSIAVPRLFRVEFSLG